MRILELGALHGRVRTTEGSNSGQGQQGRYDQAELGSLSLPPCVILLISYISTQMEGIKVARSRHQALIGAKPLEQQYILEITQVR